MTSLPVSVLVLGIGIVRRQSIGYWVLGAELGNVLTLMWGCALGPFEASALMATSPHKEERKKASNFAKC